MIRHIDAEIDKLSQKLLEMGGLVESALASALEALIKRDLPGFEKVFECEAKINEHQMMIDETCVRLLATQGPLAKDLRFIIAVLKIGTDLERMGDQAVNISYNAQHYLKEPPLKPLIDIPRMGECAKHMVRDALDAFVRQDRALAISVLSQDDEVDDLKQKIFNELVGLIKQNPDCTERAIDLILIARNLERMGDHATNIAEDVIYAVTGKDIRHGHHNPD